MIQAETERQRQRESCREADSEMGRHYHLGLKVEGRLVRQEIEAVARTRRQGSRFSSRASGRNVTCQLILGFWPPELQENECVLC